MRGHVSRAPHVLLGCVEEAPGGRKGIGTSAGNAPERNGQGRGEGAANDSEDGERESNEYKG